MLTWRFANGTCLPAQVDPGTSARNTYQEAQARYRDEPDKTEAAWHFSRACFDFAEFATNNNQRAAIAEQGIGACEKAISHEPNSAPAHYYLGMNLGQLAQTRGIGALKLVKQMEHEFSIARDLDESFDYAGPDRNLGLLYRDAPTITSIGSRTHARQHLQRAVELQPDYPENRLNLAEAYLGWSDRNGARRELKSMEELWPRARTRFSGGTWGASWVDWEQRLRKIKSKVEENSKSLDSPRKRD